MSGTGPHLSPIDASRSAAEALAGLWPCFAVTAAKPGAPGAPLEEAAKVAWLDWAAVALFGLGTDVGRTVARVVGNPGALVLQVAGTAAPEVSRLALVLAAAAHAAELDDTLPDSMVHAGAPVIAAAVAVSLARGSPAQQVLRAVAFGYEVAGRVGRAINAPPRMAVHARGFHPTGVVGVLGAAAAAGALWGLEGARLASALTLAASMGGGILEFLSGGGASKALHAGKAAADGVLAAALAAEGLAGPPHALEGRDGFLRAYGGEGNDVSPLTEPLDPRTAAVVRTRRKYHACCHHCQPSVEALSDLVRRRGFSADDVAAVEATVPTMAHYQVALPREAKQRPESRLEAQLSLPYCLAARLVVGHLGPSAFEPPHLTDPRILQLASRVRARTDEHVDASFKQGRMPAVVRVHLRSGDVVEGAVGFEESATDPVLERDRVREKWEMLLGPTMGPRQLAELWEALQAEPVQAFRWALLVSREKGGTRRAGSQVAVRSSRRPW